MLLIDGGHLAYDGSIETIRARFGAERRMRVVFEGPAPDELPPGVEEEERAEERLVLRFRRDEIPSARLLEWLAARTPIADLAIEEPPIERIVAALYRRELPPSDPSP
jgi:ABC-2 type transport system ATP-binding protein